MQKSLSPQMFVVAAREKIASRIVSLHIYTQGATCLKKIKGLIVFVKNHMIKNCRKLRSLS